MLSNFPDFTEYGQGRIGMNAETYKRNGISFLSHGRILTTLLRLDQKRRVAMIFDDEEYFEISVMESLRIIIWSVAITFGVAISLFVFVL